MRISSNLIIFCLADTFLTIFQSNSMRAEFSANFSVISKYKYSDKLNP